MYEAFQTVPEFVTKMSDQRIAERIGERIAERIHYPEPEHYLNRHCRVLRIAERIALPGTGTLFQHTLSGPAYSRAYSITRNIISYILLLLLLLLLLI